MTLQRVQRTAWASGPARPTPDCRRRCKGDGKLVLQWLLLLCLSASGVEAQIYAAEQNSTSTKLATSSLELAKHLADPRVTDIYVRGYIKLADDWPGPSSTTGTTLPVLNHAVTLRKENPDRESTIDFNQIPYAIFVGPGSKITWIGLTLRNPALRNREYHPLPQYAYNVSGLGFWPTLVAASGATYFGSNSLTIYYRKNCEAFIEQSAFALTQVFGQENVKRRSDNAVQLAGFHRITINITDLQQKPVGTINVETLDNITACQPPPGDDNSNKLAWWAWVLISLGAACVLGAGLVALLLLRRRRRNKRTTRDVETALKEAPPVDLLMSDSSNTVGVLQASKAVHGDAICAAGGGRVYNDSAQEEPVFDSRGNAILVPNCSLHDGSTKGSVESASAKGSAEKSPLHGARGSLESALDPSSSYPLASNATGASNSTLTEEVWRARVAGPLEDVEMGPMLGRGSYGRVYKGRWKGAIVAIKIVEHRTQSDSGGSHNNVDIDRESILSTSVAHPNVVSTYKLWTVPVNRNRGGQEHEDLHEDDEAQDGEEGAADPSKPQLLETWMLLEYCDRGSLHEAVAAGRFVRKSIGQARHGCRMYVNAYDAPCLLLQLSMYRCLIEIATGMDYLHSVGILHGDLKPANVLMKSTATDPRGYNCKLADFGLSRLMDLTQTHISTKSYGTVSYMPAELLSQGKLTKGCDVYSFAMLMWEIYTGQGLYTGMTVGQVFYLVVYQNHRPTIPEECPEHYAGVMQQCWAVDPAERPSFADVAKSLQAKYSEMRKEAKREQRPSIDTVSLSTTRSQLSL